MRKIVLKTLFIASMLAASSAEAGVVLLANGKLTGSSAGPNADLSGLTGTLENGLPANILGGVGSGITYAGGTTYLAVPDRGPNATPYNSSVDDTVSYISRFQTIDMQLTASAPGSQTPFTLTPTLTGTTLLFSQAPLTYGTGAGLGNKKDGTPLGSGAPSNNTSNTYYFTGRSDNYASGPGTQSTDAANARFDPESIRISNDGKSVFISDEYGPYVRQFDRATGQLIKTFDVPNDLAVTVQSPKGDTEISANANLGGRVANKGMEGLAITPDGKTLVGIMQAAVEQDANSSGNPGNANIVRIVTIDIASGQTHEYGYQLTNGSGVSDITAINDHEFLVDERDGKGLGDGSKAKVKQLFHIDINGATDIKGLKDADVANATLVSKDASPFLDIVTALADSLGLGKSDVPAKIEGISFGQDVDYNGALYHTLFVANDNDFVPDVAGQNQFFVFGFQNGDLANYAPQQLSAVPEPATWATLVLGFGVAGFAIRRARKPATQTA